MNFTPRRNAKEFIFGYGIIHYCKHTPTDFRDYEGVFFPFPSSPGQTYRDGGAEIKCNFIYIADSPIS